MNDQWWLWWSKCFKQTREELACVRLPPDLFSSHWLLPESRVCDRHELSLTLMFESYRWTHLTELKTYFWAPLHCFSRQVAQKRWHFELWLCKNYKWYEKVELFWGSPEICDASDFWLTRLFLRLVICNNINICSESKGCFLHSVRVQPLVSPVASRSCDPKCLLLFSFSWTLITVTSWSVSDSWCRRPLTYDLTAVWKSDVFFVWLHRRSRRVSSGENMYCYTSRNRWVKCNPLM